jgi:hypothetical protein
MAGQRLADKFGRGKDDFHNRCTGLLEINSDKTSANFHLHPYIQA